MYGLLLFFDFSQFGLAGGANHYVGFRGVNQGLRTRAEKHRLLEFYKSLPWGVQKSDHQKNGLYLLFFSWKRALSEKRVKIQHFLVTKYSPFSPKNRVLPDYRLGKKNGKNGPI